MTAIDQHAPAYRSVLEMATALADALKHDPSSSDYVTRQLCDAVDALDSMPSGGRFRFEPSGGDPSKVRETPDERMALAAADAQLATVMFAASRAAGEQAPPVQPEMLSDAVANASLDLDRLVSSSTNLQFQSSTALTSADLVTASARFRESSLDTFTVVIDECEQTIRQAITAIRDSADKVLETMGQVGDLLARAIPRVPLLRRAWDRLKACVDRIYQIVRGMPADTLNDWIKTIVERLSLREGVEQILATASAREQIATLALIPPLTAAKVDLASDEVALLAARFRRIADSSRIVIKGLTLCGGMIAAQFTGPTAAAIIPAAYCVVVAGQLFVGLDFTDRGSFGIVRGVLQIGHELNAGGAASGV